MIAIDTSSLIAYFSGDGGRDVDLVDDAFEKKLAVFPPVVLTEILSDHNLGTPAIKLFLQVPILGLTKGYWENAGVLRAKVLSKGLKARLADALIAQSCIDHNAPLISRDKDFRHFAKLGGLQLLE